MLKKKIVFVANSGWYIHNFRSNLIEKIISENYELVLVTPLDNYVQELIKEGYQHVEWKLSRKSINPLSEIKSLINLILILKNLKPDLVHNFTIKACLYGTLAAKLSGIKYVINAITGLGHLFVGKKISTKVLRIFLIPIYRIILSARRSNIVFKMKMIWKSLLVFVSPIKNHQVLFRVRELM